MCRLNKLGSVWWDKRQAEGLLDERKAEDGLVSINGKGAKEIHKSLKKLKQGIGNSLDFGDGTELFFAFRTDMMKISLQITALNVRLFLAHNVVNWICRFNVTVTTVYALSCH
jgi:hypothetical protein